MMFEFNVHRHCGDGCKEVGRKLDGILTLLDKLMSSQSELTVALNGLNEKLVKIGGETTKLLAAIEDLKKQVENAPVSAELQAAFDAVARQAGVVDDLVPDQPPVA